MPTPNLPVRVVFMGTPAYAVPTLQALQTDWAHVVGVVCQPDKPVGRGQQSTAPPVKTAAQALSIPVLQPVKLRHNAEFLQQLRELAPDLIVVIAYGKILPTEILELPRFGCLNLHASLLPLYRGAAPIQWALIRGETETGVTLMKMDEGLDTGAMLAKQTCAIAPVDDARSLTDKLARASADLAAQAIPRWLAAELPAEPQDENLATLAPLLTKAMGEVNWKQPAIALRRLSRGLAAWPGLSSHLLGQRVKLGRVDALEIATEASPGTILAMTEAGWQVATGDGVLLIQEIQLPGKPLRAAAEVARGWRDLRVGSSFTSEAPSPLNVS
ncbi:MAG: methionyl-tRNA formyltransferase [Candidatus Sericytochromatia bacterium]|nr:methionyl-tRNA formyltransferase [Candidatus Sericytochromatia bacterium]